MPPHRPQRIHTNPSPRKSKVSLQCPNPTASAAHSLSESNESSSGTGAGETKEHTSTAVEKDLVVRPTKTKKTEIRCRLVYTGSFGVGYTCSVCNVFREWRKVYPCNGEIETKGLGRHFASRTKQKYLQFIDGTRAISMKPLPTEILEEILKFLDYRFLCRSESTCTDWYRISHQAQFVENMADRDRKQMELNKVNVGAAAISVGSSSSSPSSSPMRSTSKSNKHMMAFVDVVHAAVRSARNACRTITLEQEIPQRIQMYATRDVRKNQIFRTKLAECSTNWIAFLLDELSRLCQDNVYRTDHPAFLAKLRFIEKELCRRRTGRAASSTDGYIEWLDELKRKVNLAVRAGRKPRMGEAKIRDLKCNWRK